MTFPKIELHVHLEGTVRPRTLLQIARRNGVTLPADSEAARHGAVYHAGIFTPAEPVKRGGRWDEVFTGYCDGAQGARERHGVEVRLTPDIPRDYPLEAAELTARHSIAYQDRGVVGLGLGGLEADFPPDPYAPAFAVARDGGIPAVPHAGEAAGPASIRAALDLLHAVRIRHGITAVEDPVLVADLAALTADYQAAQQLGLPPRDCYLAAAPGALCDEATRTRLQKIGQNYDWAPATAPASETP